MASFVSATAFARSMVPSLPRDRAFVVTGASSGLGLETCVVLAGKGATVIMAVRDVEGRGAKARDEVVRRAVDAARADVGTDTDAPPADQDAIARRVHLVRLDVAELDSVRAFPAELDRVVSGGARTRVDVLVLNAGVMALRQRETTNGGTIEKQMATNVLGHVLLTSLLLDRILESKDGRVVSVASMAHLSASGVNVDDLDRSKAYDPFGVYAETKLANLLFARKLQRLLYEAGVTNVISVSCHPGLSRTRLFDHNSMNLSASLFGQSAALGATPVLLAATDVTHHIAPFGYAGPWFFGYVGGATWHAQHVTRVAKSHAEQDKFWEWALRVTGATFNLPVKAKAEESAVAPAA